MKLSRYVLLSILFAGQAALAGPFYAGVEIGRSGFSDVADADAVSACEPICFDEPLSVNGVDFDSSETAWGAVAGWTVNDWLAIEVSYSDLGEADGRVELPVPQLVQPQPGLVVDPPLFGWVTEVDLSGFNALEGPGFVDLAVEEIALGVRLQKRLSERFSANGSIGISRANFDVRGERRVPVITGDPATVTEAISPYVAPDSETGLTLGLGVAWALSPSYSLDLGYRWHETQVVAVGTLALRFLVAF